ncbi:hypothetical protein E2C01_025552 [Portunus trituberculatus]|uniref:Uncharacterized protein n=1 Tax=Portunus trituberculatus TaxID=210409 RepID=A0A5B7EI87_PORTR|nr:hypothetical protein [Portunus trituberculatus]
MKCLGLSAGSGGGRQILREDDKTPSHVNIDLHAVRRNIINLKIVPWPRHQYFQVVRSYRIQNKAKVAEIEEVFERQGTMTLATIGTHTAAAAASLDQLRNVKARQI